MLTMNDLKIRKGLSRKGWRVILKFLLIKPSNSRSRGGYASMPHINQLDFSSLLLIRLDINKHKPRLYCQRGEAIHPLFSSNTLMCIQPITISRNNSFSIYKIPVE